MRLFQTMQRTARLSPFGFLFDLVAHELIYLNCHPCHILRQPRTSGLGALLDLPTQVYTPADTVGHCEAKV